MTRGRGAAILASINALNILTGFLLLSVVNSNFFEDKTVSALIYRSASAVVALAVVIATRRSVDTARMWRSSLFWTYLTFVLLYLARMGYDMFWNGILLPSSEYTPVSLYLGAACYLLLIPLSIASMPAAAWRSVERWGFVVMAIPFVLDTGLYEATAGVATGRHSAFEGVGVNTTSVYAAVMAGWALSRIVNPTLRLSGRALSLVVLGLAALVITMAATRSALVAVAVVSMIYLLRNVSMLTNRASIGSAIVTAALLAYTSPHWIGQSELLVARLATLVETGNAARDYIWYRAINMFVESPIIGSAFIIPGEAYFHNFILDAFVSLGILGGSLFLLLNIRVWILTWRLLRAGTPLILFPIGFATVSVVGMFSFNLFSSDLYWAYMMGVAAIGLREREDMAASRATGAAGTRSSECAKWRVGALQNCRGRRRTTVAALGNSPTKEPC